MARTCYTFMYFVSKKIYNVVKISATTCGKGLKKDLKKLHQGHKYPPNENFEIVLET